MKRDLRSCKAQSLLALNVYSTRMCDRVAVTGSTSSDTGMFTWVEQLSSCWLTIRREIFVEDEAASPSLGWAWSSIGWPCLFAAAVF